MDFGNYAVIDSVKHPFEKEPDWFWKFRPATVGDEMEMQRWINANAKRESPPTWIEVAVKQIALTSEATNIPGAQLEDGGKVVQFEELCKIMPIDMLGELWTALGEVNPLWGPPRPPESSETSEAEF